MTTPYWQKRDRAKEKIATGLRDNLVSQFSGLPVMVLRNRYDSVRKTNRAFVKEVLAELDCMDLRIAWRILFDIKDDNDGIARVSNFHVFVDPF